MVVPYVHLWCWPSSFLHSLCSPFNFYQKQRVTCQNKYVSVSFAYLIAAWKRETSVRDVVERKNHNCEPQSFLRYLICCFSVCSSLTLSHLQYVGFNGLGLVGFDGMCCWGCRKCWSRKLKNPNVWNAGQW